LCGATTWLHIQDFELDAALKLKMLDGGNARHLLYETESRLLGRAERLSTITEAMRRRVVEKGVPEERTYLFPNWADLCSVRPMPLSNEVRHKLGARPDDVLVLHAGNMGEKQGLDLVLEAADRLRIHKEIKFALAGAGAMRDTLEKTAKRRGLDNVRFFPVQSPEYLPLMLAAGDIHLVVQRREAADLVMPSKLTNILAAGRPTVATAAPGTTLYRILNEYDCGITTTPGSTEELARAIGSLAKDLQMRERLARNARRYAEAHLDKEEILSSFERELQELVGSGT
jgi:colanic acid biosynthesis glycosyl transferase WcaI